MSGGDAGLSAQSDNTSRIDLVNSGLIEGARDGIRLIDLTAQINNAAEGIIQGISDNAIETQGRLRLVNFGQVLAGGNGDGIVLGAGSALSHITNWGTIASVSGSAIDASAVLAGGPVLFNNLGTVIGSYTGAETIDSLTNRGTRDSVFTGLDDDQVRNLGLITGYVFLGGGIFGHRGGRGPLYRRQRHGVWRCQRRRSGRLAIATDQQACGHGG